MYLGVAAVARIAAAGLRRALNVEAVARDDDYQNDPPVTYHSADSGARTRPLETKIHRSEWELAQTQLKSMANTRIGNSGRPAQINAQWLPYLDDKRIAVRVGKLICILKYLSHAANARCRLMK